MRLGADVTVVELLPQIVPFADSKAAQLLRTSLKRQGMTFRTRTEVKSVTAKDEVLTVSVEDDKGKTDEIECDRVLVAVGRKPYTKGLGLDEAGVKLDERGRIAVGEGFETSAPGIYAIGDVIEGPMLAHKAEEEGVAVAELLAGKAGHADKATIPSVVYTSPELAQVGLTEKQAKDKGLPVRIGSYPFRPNGRAKSLGETDGAVKIVAHAETDRILGVHIVGPRASELIAEAVTAMTFAGSAEDLARTVHAHPTLAEAIKEAALAVDKRPIHG